MEAPPRPRGGMGGAREGTQCLNPLQTAGLAGQAHGQCWLRRGYHAVRGFPK